MAEQYIGSIIGEISSPISPPVSPVKTHWWQDWRIYAAAASILILIVFGSKLLLNPSTTLPKTYALAEQTEWVVDQYRRSGGREIDYLKDSLSYLIENKPSDPRALSMANQLITNNPDDAVSRIYRGLVFIHQNQVDKALEDWRWVFNQPTKYYKKEVCLSARMIFETLYREEDRAGLLDFQNQWESIQDYGCFEDLSEGITIKERVNLVLKRMQENTE